MVDHAGRGLVVDPSLAGLALVRSPARGCTQTLVAGADPAGAPFARAMIRDVDAAALR